MRRRLWLLSILAAIILCLLVVDTYGLFETNSYGDSEFAVGKWVILLNNTDVSLARTITLCDFTYSGNQHIQSGYFAPGGTAILDITIDASDTDVALEYSIDFDTTELASHPNMTLTITNLDTNQTLQGTSYSGTMYLNDNRVISLELALTWTNNSSYDENDSELIDNPLAFTMDMEFNQLIET